MQPSARANWLLLVLIALVFCSGASALIYQVLWLRLLALVFGVTAWAVSTVLASFMGGLALGSLAVGRLADRVRNPLRWYGLAELLVGLSALATPGALELVEQGYTALYPALPHALGPLTVVRFVLSFAVLLVPTTLMGATLPLIIRSSLVQTTALGQRASLLYAANTAGAVAGTLLAGFFLVGGTGITAAFLLAAGLNGLVGTAAIATSLVLLQQAGQTPATRAASEPVGSASPMSLITDRTRRLVLLVFAVSGFAALALEVLWVRVLVLYLVASTYAFTVMLATVLLGIALGSFLVAPLMRRRLDWLLLLAGLELAIGVTAVLSLSALARGPDVLTGLGALLGRQALSLPGELAPALVSSFVALFPASLLMGVAFPIGLRLWAGEGGTATSRTGERVGIFYGLNVFGAILGSVAAGFVLLPLLGSQASLVAVAGLSLLSGLLLVSAKGVTRGSAALGVVGTAAFLAGVLTMPDPFVDAVTRRYGDERLLWHEEGPQVTVTLHQQRSGTRTLYLDGRYQASDDAGQLRIHRVVGHLPMVLHPRPRTALVVGLGGGVTAGAVSQHGAAVDVVELADAVVNATPAFRHVNGDPLRQPNVNLLVDDGRNYLLTTSRRYDVITSDLIGPNHVGAGSLYSAEYFRLARNVLEEDGLMLQWLVPLPETQHKLIMRTFLRVFPESTLWFEGTLLVGSKRPLELNPADFERQLGDAALREALAEAGLGSFDALLAQYWAGPEELGRYVGAGPILTDDQPMVEYFLSLPQGEPGPNLSALRVEPRQLVKQ